MALRPAAPGSTGSCAAAERRPCGELGAPRRRARGAFLKGRGLRAPHREPARLVF